jgi:hypothetical protein
MTRPQSSVTFRRFDAVYPGGSMINSVANAAGTTWDTVTFNGSPFTGATRTT